MFKQTAKEFHQSFVDGGVSAKQIAESTLARLRAHDPKIGAFLNILSERLLKKASELDQKRSSGKPLGKLAGVPIAVKDNIHIKGEFTTCASKFLSNYRAVFDATVVRLMEEEDALLIGKTNLDEFAMGSSTENSAFHPTRNPWELSCTPGGSSGGSAASVAARLCPLSLGSDTGGSIRLPASLTGVFGFKPTYGRVSRYGLVAFASSLDQIGPLSTNVEDMALLMEVIGRHCPNDSTSLSLPEERYTSHLHSSLKNTSIGVPWFFVDQLPQDVRENFLSSIEKLKNLGATIIDIDLNLLKYSVGIYYILATAEASTNLARFDGIRYGHRSKNASSLEEVYELSRQEGFGMEVKNRILLGTYVLSAGYQDAFYKKAQKVRTLMINQFKEAFNTCDLIALPCAPFPAFSLGMIQDPLQMYLLDLFTIPANLAGLPAISIPSGFNREHKPLSFQLMGPAMHDKNVLSAAYAFQKASSFHEKIPPLFASES